jgi:DNA polymerase elongation subunit (family B)
VSGNVTKEELFIYKKIGKEDSYKSKTADMALFIKYMKSKGEEPSAGDRYEYLLAKIETNYKGEKYRTLAHLEEDGLDIDYMLYLESNFVKPIQKILHRWNPEKFSKNLLSLLLKYMDVTGNDKLKERFIELVNSGQDIAEKIKEIKKNK